MRMRACLLVSLIFLSMFISEIQGIRLNKEFLSASHHKIQEGILVKRSDKPAGEATECRHEDCSGSTKVTDKETSKPTTTIATISKTDKIIGGTKEGFGRKEEIFSIDSRPVSEHPGATTDQHSDILDLAGMDYSPAKRKPPIHN